MAIYVATTRHLGRGQNGVTLSTRAEREGARTEVRQQKKDALDKGFLSLPELADALGVRPQTIHKWNCAGTAPKRYRLGRAVFYARADVDAWLEARVVA